MSGLIDNTAHRARRLLARPGAWIEAGAGAYALRLNPDRRRRPAMTLDDVVFREIADSPGLIAAGPRAWRPRTARDAAPEPGRPGQIPGRRQVIGPDGRMLSVNANLGESPIAWLARRKDAQGRPWLSAMEAAAGERLRADAERASLGERLTSRWDALPRGGSGAAMSGDIHGGRLAAARRVARALAAVDPRLRPMLEAICIRSSSLGLAEHELAMPRRSGKHLLRQGLAQLARHYGG